MDANIPDIGQTAPDFTVTDAFGSSFTLSETLNSGRTVKLVFYRGHW